ncbi:putative cation-transporting ATPase 13A5 [Phytophthora ramorum]|uniref:putative cation-transporting ATPase 13A5 n=1 Tax=Phytophthora ramorum TaxID=164328 RepID=UPI0030A2D63A|nr:putative cation-transporting ATPase 13A5 [Phytophthora ramorum]
MIHRSLLALAVVPMAFVHAEQANQLAFAACPVSHSPEYYCCQYSSSNMEIYTKFNLPTGGSYDEFYRKGWNEGRRVNYPYHKFTPDSPTFYYDEPSSVCRMQVVVTDFSSGSMTYELQCASANSTLEEDSRDSTVFWTSPSNSRNNNASFPVGAQCTSLMTDGLVNATAKAACVSESATVTPQFTSYGEGKLLLVYFLYLAVFVLIGLWMAYKHVLQSKNESVDEMARKLLTSPATPLKSVAGYSEARNSHVRDSDLHIQRVASDSVFQTGYKASKVGYVVFSYFVAATLALNALVIIVICDYYAKFTPTLFGSDNALVFFIVWLFSAGWFASIVLLREQIVNFFRLRVELNKAEYVHLFKRDDTEVLLADRSGVSDLVQRIESVFSNKSKLSGYQETVRVNQAGSLRFLTFQHLRYIYDDSEKRFVPGAVALGETHRDIMRDAGGLSTTEAESRLQTVGANAVDVALPSVGKSLIQEFFTLFYIYQIMCYYVWYYFTYWNLGIVMTLVVVGTAVINIYTKRKMQAAIVKMTRYRTEVSVFRDNEWKTLESPQLVPGDLVKVPENWIIPCDMVIVKGTTVCDESMLTGESMPVQKFPIPDHSATIYDAEGRGKKHTLFSGTRVLSSGRNEEIHGVVQTTGAHTTKGQLIQSILFPVPMRFKYDEHLKALIALLLVYSFVGCYLGINFLTSNGKLTNKMTAFCYCIFLISAVRLII